MADASSTTSSKVLFEITEDLLDTGLRGFPVGTCKTSAVDPETGVSYVGYPIADLKDLPAEDVIYLLFHKNLPTKEQATAFKADLAKRSKVPDDVFKLLKGLPKKGHPMEWFLAGILGLGMTGKTGDYNEDVLNLVARIRTLVAAIYRIREGWGDPIPR
jgi:citrate synthase